MNNDNLHIEKLISIIRKLRSEQGCPWDKKQTATSLKKYLQEEVEELLEAVENNDSVNVCEEIGDVLYVLAMIAEIHREKSLFTFNDCISSINDKLIRRHPHVFETQSSLSDVELRKQWEKIKSEEKKRNN